MYPEKFLKKWIWQKTISFLKYWTLVEKMIIFLSAACKSKRYIIFTLFKIWNLVFEVAWAYENKKFLSSSLDSSVLYINPPRGFCAPALLANKKEKYSDVCVLSSRILYVSPTYRITLKHRTDTYADPEASWEAFYL